MRIFSNFIIKTTIFICVLFLVLSFCTFIFSIKNNMSFPDSISYFKTAITEFISLKQSNQNSVHINSNTADSHDNNIMIFNIDYYYYAQLDNNAKLIYNSLEKNLDNLKKDNYTIDFSTTFNDLLNKSSGRYKLNKSFQSALDAFFFDHPELFYLDLSKFILNIKCLSIGSLKTYTAQIIPRDGDNYLNDSFNSQSEVNLAISKVEKERNTLINSIPNDDTYQKIKYIHDTLVNSITYDTTYKEQNIHNIYGALVQKKVVCEGYAKVFKYLMNSINVECILVSGTATNSSNESESHMWNYVKLDNNWYGVDVTWDDPIIIGGNNENSLRHNYFLKGYKAFTSTHIASGRMSDTGMLFTIPFLADKNYKY